METQVTPEQFDQAVNILASICATAPVPEGTQLTLWQWVDANRNALNIVVALARETLEPKTTNLDESYELVDVSANGDG